MANYTKTDRKQVFGVEELDEKYMKRIKALFDEKIKDMTFSVKDKSVTMPLSNWV